MERGDIYLVSLDPTSGHEQQGARPVLLVVQTRGTTSLGVSRKTLSKIVNGNSGISAEMEFRRSIAFGGS